MSLAFQNAESIKQALFEELQNLLSSEQRVLTLAEQRIKQLEYTDGFGVYLAELIMNQSFEIPLRQIACIMLTRYVENHWCAEPKSVAGDANCTPSEQAKRTIRNILPNGLYDPNSKIRNFLVHTISTIALTDWPDVWTDFFDIIIKCLGGNEDSIHGAMLILEEFSYDDKQIKELGPIVISEVYRIFESENYSIKTRALAIRILKPLFLSIKGNISNKQEKASISNWIINSFMPELLQYLSMNGQRTSNFLLRTEIVKLFTFLLTDMPSYIEPHMKNILPVIWQLLTQVADIYVKVIVNRIEPSPFPSADNEEDDEFANFTIMIIQIFEFIQTVICSTRCRDTILSVLKDLIYIVIVYIQTTEEQIEDWQDPDNFLDDEYDSAVNITIRVSGQDVLVALKDDLDAECLQSLQDALGRHMNVAEAEKAAGNTHWWKIQDACIVAMTTFNKTIMDNQDSFDLINYLKAMNNLLNCQDQPYLVGRALLSMSTYVYAVVFDLPMLEHVLVVAQDCLQCDKPIVLKIFGVKAIANFIEANEGNVEEKKAIIKPKLGGFFEGIFNIIAGSNNSTLALLLETISNMISFDDTFTTQHAQRLIPLTLAIFLKYNEDPFLLEIILDMVKSLCQNRSCLLPLQEKFIPVSISMLSGQGERINSALEVLTTIVRYSTAPLPEPIIDAFPAVVRCILESDDNSVMVTGGECLRAFIFVAPEQVCAYKNGEGLNYVMQVTTMLLNPMNNEMTAGQIGRLVITIIIKMGNMLGENIDLLLKAVISKMQMVECLKVMMSLVVVFAHLFLTQMDAVLNFLSTLPGPTGEPAMQFVLNNWLVKQTSFFGCYERKVTTMALCKLFEYGVTTQDTRLTSITTKELVIADAPSETQRVRTRSQTATAQKWETVPVLVKIFKLLIHELTNLKESRCLFDSDDDDDEEADDQQDNSSGGVSGTGAKKGSPSKPRYTSDLYFADDDDENSDDDQLLLELMKDPIFQANMEENLTKFLQKFANSKHFPMFASQLNAEEKNTLKQIGIKV